MSWLQSVQNVAAHLVSGARHYDPITLVLQELHWLPVRHRVDFKMATRSTWHCLAWLQHTWPLTVSWSPTKVVVRCVLPTQEHVSSDGHTAVTETDALLLQVRGCGTNFQHI